mgnify:CR=1 FL=1
MKTNYKKTPEPNYYIGTTYGYEARRVVEDFELSYNTGTAVSYLLRAGKKDGNPADQDIQKAIDHLKFELELYNKKENYADNKDKQSQSKS